MADFPRFFDHILALLFGVIVPLVSGFRSARNFPMMQFTEKDRRRFYWSNSSFLLGMALLVMVNWLLQGRSPDWIGLTRKPVFVLPVILFTVFFSVIYVLDTWLSLRENRRQTGKEEEDPAQERMAPFLPEKYRELFVYSFMCVAAGVGEEIVYRGFMITYASRIFSPLPYPDTWAIVVPAVIFAFAHYYQGFKAVVKIAILSILFGLIFVESKSLWIVIILHFAIDLAGGVLVVRERRSA